MTCAVNCCVSRIQYSVFFYGLSTINFPMKNLIQSSFIVNFVYHIQQLPPFLPAEIVSVNPFLIL